MALLGFVVGSQAGLVGRWIHFEDSKIITGRVDHSHPVFFPVLFSLYTIKMPAHQAGINCK